jgi:ribonuclease T1
VKKLLLLLATVLALVSACAAPSATDAASSPDIAVQGVTGLPTVALTELPDEAQQTYDLIIDGGPFPYRQDDQVFGNREGLLPDEEYGWYREYTIPTPGSSDRGAQRFVVSEDDIFFYTDDHYDSFSEVLP